MTCERRTASLCTKATRSHARSRFQLALPPKNLKMSHIFCSVPWRAPPRESQPVARPVLAHTHSASSRLSARARKHTRLGSTALPATAQQNASKGTGWCLLSATKTTAWQVSNAWMHTAELCHTPACWACGQHGTLPAAQAGPAPLYMASAAAAHRAADFGGCLAVLVPVLHVLVVNEHLARGLPMSALPPLLPMGPPQGRSLIAR